MGSPTIPSKSSPATREKLAPSTQDVLVPRKDADPDKQTRMTPLLPACRLYTQDSLSHFSETVSGEHTEHSWRDFSKIPCGAKSYFGSFNNELRGKNEKHCDQYPDDVADRQRQTSDR